MKCDGLTIPGVSLRSAPGYVQVAPAGRARLIDYWAVLHYFLK